MQLNSQTIITRNTVFRLSTPEMLTVRQSGECLLRMPRLTIIRQINLLTVLLIIALSPSFFSNVDSWPTVIDF